MFPEVEAGRFQFATRNWTKESRRAGLQKVSSAEARALPDFCWIYIVTYHLDENKLAERDQN